VNELGGLQTIANTLEQLETHGGIEGVEQMLEDLELGKKLEAGLEKGDRALVESWAKDFPDGFKRSVLPMLEQLEKLDEERYEQTSSAVIAHVFEKFGVFGVMSTLGKALSEGKTEDAIKQFNDLARFMSQAKTLAGNARSDPYASRATELDAREQRIAEENAKSFKTAVRSDVNRDVTSAMNNQLRDHLRDLKVFKVESGTANRMRKEINRELQRLVASDPNYSRQYESVMKSNDRNRAAQFVIKAALRKLPEAIKSVARDFNLRPTGKAGQQVRKRLPTGGGGNNRGGGDGGGSRVVSGVPKTADVDFRRTDMAKFLATKHGHGTAWLKDGKQAKW
jgi:hypothetical protein